MKKSIYLSKQVWLNAIDAVIYRGGKVRASHIASQFGIQRTYANRLLKQLHAEGKVSRIVIGYRKDICYEYMMTPEQKYFHSRDRAMDCTESLLQAYAVKSANEIRHALSKGTHNG